VDKVGPACDDPVAPNPVREDVMKRALVVALVVVVVGFGILAVYRAVQIPQLPTAPSDLSRDRPRGALPMLAFEAGPDRHYLAVFGDDHESATLLGPAGIRTLTPRRAASGAKYADDEYLLWTKGKDLMFEIDGERVPDVRVTGRQGVLERHWQAGVLLVATGEEPDWFLTVRADGAELILGGYTERHDFVSGAPDLPHGLAPHGTWTLGEPPLTAELTVTPGLCLDTMAGFPYAAEAELRFGDRTLRGCALGLR
jgi:hypothetical protein